MMEGRVIARAVAVRDLKDSKGKTILRRVRFRIEVREIPFWDTSGPYRKRAGGMIDWSATAFVRGAKRIKKALRLPLCASVEINRTGKGIVDNSTAVMGRLFDDDSTCEIKIAGSGPLQGVKIRRRGPLGPSLITIGKPLQVEK